MGRRCTTVRDSEGHMVGLVGPTYPKIWGLSAYPLLTISNLTTRIIVFDILSPRAFRKYTTPMVFREFLKNPTYPKMWGLSAYPLLSILNLTTGIIIFDILSPRAFRKYITPTGFREFFKNPTYPKKRGLSYPFLKKKLKK